VSPTDEETSTRRLDDPGGNTYNEPMGSMAGRKLLARRTAATRSRSQRCMRQATPAVPARCAPARQWMRTLLPCAVSPSTKSKSGLKNSRAVPRISVPQSPMGNLRSVFENKEERGQERNSPATGRPYRASEILHGRVLGMLMRT